MEKKADSKEKTLTNFRIVHNANTLAEMNRERRVTVMLATFLVIVSFNADLPARKQEIRDKMEAQYRNLFSESSPVKEPSGLNSKTALSLPQ